MKKHPKPDASAFTGTEGGLGGILLIMESRHPTGLERRSLISDKRNE